MTTATEISNRIIEAVMAQKLAPGSRLGEQLAMLFDCSRTIVREALTRLATRGIVTVSARRGWYRQAEPHAGNPLMIVAAFLPPTVGTPVHTPKRPCVPPRRGASLASRPCGQKGDGWSGDNPASSVR